MKTRYIAKFIKKNSHSESGKLRNRAEQWVVIVVFLLILGFALLNSTFNQEIRGIISTFFDQRLLNQAANSATFNSWPYVLLYVLFGLTMGMYLFLVSRYLQLNYFVNGIRLFFILSISVMLVIALRSITSLPEEKSNGKTLYLLFTFKLFSCGNTFSAPHSGI